MGLDDSDALPPGMTADEFRRHGHALVDWIAAYWERAGDFPVRATVAPGDVRAMLPADPPEKGESFDRIARDLDDVILPGLTHWQSPNFFAFFPANVSPPAVLAELVSAGLGTQGMLWITSPACTEVETHVLDWLVTLLELPAKFRSTGAGGAVIQDTASSASLCALLAARERATGGQTNATGIDRTFTTYASVDAHSSIAKAAMISGIGRDHVRKIPVDDRGAIIPAALDAAIAADRAAGHEPLFVCATVGTTSTGSIDPVAPLADTCEREGLWLHVDAAWAGSAAVCPEFRAMHDGLDRADSYCFNPHKWLLTNFDCSCFFVADRHALIRSMSILPEYLKNDATQSGTVIDYRDWHVPLGRRFRALKLWFVIRTYGAEGLRAHIRKHVRLAQDFADRVRGHGDLELTLTPSLSLVCFHHRGGDEKTEALLNALNDSGALYLTHTRFNDRFTIRVAIGGTFTREEHVRAAWGRIDRAARMSR